MIEVLFNAGPWRRCGSTWALKVSTPLSFGRRSKIWSSKPSLRECPVFEALFCICRLFLWMCTHSCSSKLNLSVLSLPMAGLTHMWTRWWRCMYVLPTAVMSCLALTSCWMRIWSHGCWRWTSHPGTACRKSWSLSCSECTVVRQV